jgi:pimeloyl-ACP methyl ester carboxylesterase
MVAVNGVELLVEASGDGPPLVLVHGSWADRSTWAFVEGELARSFHVVRYDRRGHSASSDSSRPGTRRDDEDDLAALVERFGLAPAHLVGNSFGASIALGLAARRPELVRSVCAHEPPLMALAAGDPAVVEANQRVAEVLELIAAGRPDDGVRHFVERVALGPGAWELLPPAERERLAANAPTFAGEAQDPEGFAVDAAALREHAVPTLLTRGDESPACFRPVVDRLAAELPHARVEVVPGAGHVPHMTHPAEWSALVREYLHAVR